MGSIGTEVIIAPSLLSADLGSLTTEIQDIEAVGAKWLHLDVMDGAFVPPITFGDNVVKLARSISKLHLDVHLMIEKPEKHLDAFIKAGSNTITFHQEATPHAHRLLHQIKSAGVLAGISINPATPVSMVFDVLDVCDLVLVMSVNPGWGGQKFIQNSLQRIAALKEEITRRNLNTRIEVDGGINSVTAKEVKAAGATILVAGNAIFGEKDRRSAFNALK